MAGCDPSRRLATEAKRWTTRTNTVFIDAKTRGVAVPIARLSIDPISSQNWQFETHALFAAIDPESKVHVIPKIAGG